MLTLELGPGLKLPALEAQTQTYIVYGGKGMGKTNSIAVFAEELNTHGLKFSLLDPVGVSWGLKHSADGKGPGINVLILGGIHADLPIEPTAGAVIADFVVDEDVSVIIDISRKPDGRMWSHTEQIKFVRDYCLQLFARNGERRRPLMQLIDECGRFAPEQPPKGAEDLVACKSAIEQLVEWGRNVGIGVYLSTQRSARMAKSISELADVMIAFRTIGPRSINAIVDWFGEHIASALQKGYIEQIRQLERGVAMVVSPGWLKLEGAFILRARRTFDSSATPVAGKERKPSGKGTRLPDLAKYRALMTETIEKAQASDPRALNRKIAELEKAYAKLQAEKSKPVAAPAAPPKIEYEEVLVVPDEVWAVHGLLLDVTSTLNKIEIAGRSGYDVIMRATKALERAKTAMDAAKPKRKAPARTPKLAPAAHSSAAPKATATPPRGEGSGGELPEGDRKVLMIAARYSEGLNRNRLAVLAGHSPKKSTIRGILGRLRAAGYITPAGVDPIVVTVQGAEYIGPYMEPLPSGPELLTWWRNEIGETDARVLDAYIKAWPNDASKEEVAEASGHDPGKSTIRGIIGRLRGRGLVEGNRISDDFMEAIAS